MITSPPLPQTYSADQLVTDSSAAATALLCGVKGNQQTVGVDNNVIHGDCAAMNVPEYQTRSILREFQVCGGRGNVCLWRGKVML